MHQNLLILWRLAVEEVIPVAMGFSRFVLVAVTTTRILSQTQISVQL
jgi:hypothetical protein